jgi:uncharacterized membrane protein
VTHAHTAPGDRKRYLDWLRGVGVLVMIQGHVIDSWTLTEDRRREAYHVISFVGGVGGAPLFLFLAGVALTLGAVARVKRGRTEAEAAALARRRGWQIFGLAFLFRLQSWIISGGPPSSLLKVDILNIIGLSMVAAALILSIRRPWRAALFTVAAVACAMFTPIVRALAPLAALPDPLERYLRPVGTATAFTLFPWAGFLLAGCAVGLWLDTKTPREERWVNYAVALLGAALLVAGYGASFLPAIYAQTDFWTSSPTFFFIRLGFLLMLVGVAYVWHTDRRGQSRVPMFFTSAPLVELGGSSLFVYWIHVEMAYGILTAPLHRRLPLEQAYVGFLLFALMLYGLVKAKNRVLGFKGAQVLGFRFMGSRFIGSRRRASSI